MPEPLRPASTKTYSRRNLFLVDAIAGYATGVGPTVAELTAASTLDITRIMTSGATLPTQSTEKVRQDARWGDTETFEFVGETQHSGGDMLYALATQGATGSDGRKLYEKVPNGATKFLVRRLGVARSVAAVAGQNVTYWPIEMGPTIDDENNAGAANAEAVGRASYAVTGPPVILTPILA